MAATQTLPAIDISFSSELPITYRLNRVAFGGGYSQRSVDGLNAKSKNWNVVWEGITKTQANTLESFFDGLDGGTEAFLWTDPMTSTENQYTLHEGKLTRTPIGHDTERVTAVFIQEFDL